MIHEAECAQNKWLITSNEGKRKKQEAESNETRSSLLHSCEPVPGLCSVTENPGAGRRTTRAFSKHEIM